MKATPPDYFREGSGSNEVIDDFYGEHNFLLNTYPAPHILQGINYPTVEHSFQAYKSLDMKERYYIAKLDTPFEAIEYGRNQIALRYDWEAVKTKIMYVCVLHKFSFQPSLGLKLVSTGDSTLTYENIERDTFWGTHKGVGQNALGRILMSVRKTLYPLYEQA